ncbi:MAG: hypothetical protein QW802_03470 [Candidatus Altiarchaeota archaeon]
MKFNEIEKKTWAENLFERACIGTNKYFSFFFKGINLEWDKELESSIEFSQLNVKPREVVVFAWSIALLSLVFSLIVAIVSFALKIGNYLLFILVGFIFALFSAYYIPEYPKKLASLKRIRALSYAPEIVAYLVIPLKQNPNLEDAVKFAAEYGQGEIALDLKKAILETWAGNYKSIGESLPLLGYKWGKHIKGFEDAMYAIRTSQIEKSEQRRLNTLDRAIDSLLKGIQKKFDEFVNYLRLPTMLIFAFGALFPLVVTILLPLISFIIIDMGTPINLFIGLLSIIIGVFLFSEHTLRKRPSTFPFIEIPDNHPDLPPRGKMKLFGKEKSIFKISVGTGILISSLSLPFLLSLQHPITNFLNTLPIIIGISLCLWIYLRETSLQKKKIRDEIKETEEDMIEATFHLGNRLLSGMSAEEAFVRVSELMSKPNGGKNYKSKIKEIFERAARNVKYMNLGLEESFFDEKIGALKDIYSGMIRGIFRIFIISMKKSIRTASESLITTANHIREIKRMEDSLKEKISYTTQMMKLTATIITPAICALTVYIAEVFKKIITETKTVMSVGTSAEFETSLILKPPATSPEILQLIVGIYMLLLLIVLIRYVTILENGDDPILVKIEIAKNIPIALITFLTTLFMSKIFF